MNYTIIFYRPNKTKYGNECISNSDFEFYTTDDINSIINEVYCKKWQNHIKHEFFHDVEYTILFDGVHHHEVYDDEKHTHLCKTYARIEYESDEKFKERKVEEEKKKTKERLKKKIAEEKNEKEIELYQKLHKKYGTVL